MMGGDEGDEGGEEAFLEMMEQEEMMGRREGEHQ